MEFEDSCMPRLFQISDELAIRAQNKFLWGVKLHITGLVGASVSQAIASLGPAYLPCLFLDPIVVLFRCLVAIFVFLALFTRLLLRQRYWEGIWIKSRAVAEQLRRASWQYMMGLSIDNPPQPHTDDHAEQRRRFLDLIGAFSSQFVKIIPSGFSLRTDLPDVSPDMEAIRKLPSIERLHFYVANQVKQQAEWLDMKARLNDQYARRCAWGVNIAELLALLMVVVIFFRRGESEWLSLLWPLLTIAASVLAWTGYKRYSEVSSSYKETAEALISIRNELEDCGRDQQVDRERFANLVFASEDVLARQNTVKPPQ